MSLKFVILLAIFAAATANTSVNMRPCPNGQPMPVSFISEFCTTTRCTLTRGRTFTGVAHVISQDHFEELIVSVDARALGISIDMRVPPGYEDACDFLKIGECPVAPDDEVHWGLEFPVPTTLPSFRNVVITLSAGQGGRNIACGIVDATLN